jgi:CheY-like chemotaxis protein/two-component sensor histidine kinase
MEAVGTLAGGIAHDFNNLLTAILGFSEMARAEISQQSPVAERLRVIQEAGEKAAALTRQLLAFSRKQVLEVKVVDIDRIVENLAKILRRTIGEDVQLDIRAAPGAKCVKADAGQLEQVLMNLAVNARDAMPQGGRLTIDTGLVDLDEGYTRDHAGVIPGLYVMLAVSDNGQGMSREVQEKIFEPFYSTKGDRGTGLGLSTVYGIVRQHGGHINVYSEPLVGTTFKIYLPLVGEAAEEEAPAEQGAELRGTETILVVDDERYIRRLVVDTLKPLGYTLLQASSAQEALQISATAAGGIDVLITDVVMPGMNGIELARRISESRPSITVIFASGYTDGAVFNAGMLAERANFLQKPITPKKLIGKLKSIGVRRAAAL